MICLFDLTIILCLMDVRNPKIYALKKNTKIVYRS